MKKELQQKLFNDFPKIFKYNRGIKRDVMLPMAFGCECGDGWYNIINHMCKMLQSDVDKNLKTQTCGHALSLLLHRPLADPDR